MRNQLERQRGESGSAVVEFAFCCLLMMPLLMGLIAIGFALIREMQVVQVCRDAGHMYAKGVDFSVSSPPNPNRATLISIGTGLGLSDPQQISGAVSPGTIILTTIMLVTQADCTAGGFSSGCANQGKPVITNQIIIGDSTLASTYGTPISSDYLNGAGNQASHVPPALTQYWVPTQSGQFVYVSEVRVTNHAFDWTGYVGSTVAATSFF